MPENPPKDNRPPEGEIPDILEWKLDVLMAQLARMGGGQPSDHNPQLGTPTTRERLPDPRKFNPRDPVPEYPGIPKILEWKLDVLIWQAGLGNNIIIFFWPLIVVLLNIVIAGLAGILALLALIAGLLAGIQALLAFILVMIMFVIVQVVVPAIIRRNREKAMAIP
jgi:hypothetical protein